MSDRLQGLRVLLVEDETLVALLIEELLEELGCVMAAVASNLEDGITAAQDGAFDFAVLDVNVAGRPVFPLAARLAEQGLPFIFSTGYGRAGLPAEWSDRPVIQKPYAIGDLANAIRRAAPDRSAAVSE